MYQLPKEILDQLPVGEITKVNGETYYRTKERVFVFRMNEDNIGNFPDWVMVQWSPQVTKTSKGRGSEGWHEDFELESRRHLSGEAEQAAIYQEEKESQDQT